MFNILNHPTLNVLKFLSLILAAFASVWLFWDTFSPTETVEAIYYMAHIINSVLSVIVYAIFLVKHIDQANEMRFPRHLLWLVASLLSFVLAEKVHQSLSVEDVFVVILPIHLIVTHGLLYAICAVSDKYREENYIVWINTVVVFLMVNFTTLLVGLSSYAMGIVPYIGSVSPMVWSVTIIVIFVIVFKKEITKLRQKK